MEALYEVGNPELVHPEDRSGTVSSSMEWRRGGTRTFVEGVELPDVGGS